MTLFLFLIVACNVVASSDADDEYNAATMLEQEELTSPSEEDPSMTGTIATTDMDVGDDADAAAIMARNLETLKLKSKKPYQPKKSTPKKDPSQDSSSL